VDLLPRWCRGGRISSRDESCFGGSRVFVRWLLWICIAGLSVGLNFRSVGCLFILAILAEAEENAHSDGSYEG
jgi:hypothetical protein